MKSKILIADDERNIRLLYRTEFEHEGYEVELAENGMECLKKIETFKPDLVILDIRMPGIDGLETLNQILGKNNVLPVIINSAYSAYKDNFMSWSADAYIVKSSDLTELKEKVKELLSESN
ncbi:response regulator [bacterium]|nr:response regulator [bacterium]